MNFAEISKTACGSLKLARPLLKLQKHSPIIMFSAGIVGVVGAVILASRATLKLEEVLDKKDKDIKMAANMLAEERNDYDEKDHQKDVALIYTRMALDITKMYALPVVILTASIGALTGSHIILTNRNISLTAAYAALEKGFKEYRQRVSDRFGEDVDTELRYAMEDHEIVEETDEGPVVKTIKRPGLKGASIYARFFDESSSAWKSEGMYNQPFLAGQEHWANTKLRAQGHLFLNEVYEAIGLPRTREGSIVGWIYNTDRGDGYVDFGIFRNNKASATDFVNCYEKSVLIDPNVDGVIWNLI